MSHNLRSRLEIFAKSIGIPMDGRTKVTHIDQEWLNYSLQVASCVPIVELAVIVDTSPRSDAVAASGDRPSTTSGDREQDFRTGFSHPLLDW